MPFASITLAPGLDAGRDLPALAADVREALIAVEGEGLRPGVGVSVVCLPQGGVMAGCAVWARIALIDGALSPESRRAMLAGTHRAITSAFPDVPPLAIWIVLETSIANGEWFAGGTPLTYDLLAALRDGRNPFA